MVRKADAHNGDPALPNLTMKKFFISVLILFHTISLSLGVGIYFGGANIPVCAAETEQSPDMQTVSAEPPENLKELQAASDEQLDAWTKLSEFDGRKYGYITREKNQGSFGICWAYAAVGAVEAGILREGIDTSVNRETLDLDEAIAAYVRFNRDGSHDPLYLTANDTYSSDNWRNSGGHADDVFASMSQGYSPVGQKTNDGSYASDGFIKNNIKQSKYFVQGYSPVSKNSEAIKRAILQYGSVTMEYKAPQTSYQKYLYYSNGTSLGHASLIIGWDDSISREKFSPDKPEHDGAWIIKNSWGKGGIEENGTYAFYLSYDPYLSNNLYTVDMDTRENYQNIYYYDGRLDTSLKNYYAEAQAAIFEAKLSSATKREQLTAVVVDLSQSDLDVTVKIYKGLKVNAGNVNDKINIPDQGTPVSITEAHFDKGGLHTIDLKSPVDLEQGEYFSVVVSCKNAYDYVPVLCSVDNGDSVNDMTYHLYNGVWKSYKASTFYADSSSDNMTARIRAVTNTVPRKNALENDLKYARVEIPNRLLFYSKDAELVPEIKVYFDDKLLNAGQDYDVEISNNTAPGQATIKITGKGSYSGTRTTCYEIGKLRFPPGRITETIDVYNDIVWLHEIPIPEGWQWIGDDIKLENGYSYFAYSIKYVGEDAEFYQILTCDFHVNKHIEEPPEKIDISGAEVRIEGEYTYTGSAITPTVIVICNDRQLIAGKNYTLSCLNNKNAGEASVTVTGIGQYKGEICKTFRINKADFPKPLPESEISVSRRTQTLKDVPLKCEGWYWQNPNQPINGEKMTATAVYNGQDKANYNHTEIQITVTKEAKRDISEITVQLGQTQFVYDGRSKTPDVIASDGNFILEKDKDFRVEYTNNINAGDSAYATVTGINDYTGLVKLSFAIDKAFRQGFSVAQQGWTFGDKAPLPHVTVQDENAKVTYLYSAHENGPFTENIPENAGTYWIKAQIEESQNYKSAQSTAQFVISRKDIGNFTLIVKAENLIYTGQALCPEVSVLNGQTALLQNTDYTVAYGNNINAGITATVTITGTNNYTGQIAQNFEISKAKNFDINTTIHVQHMLNNLSEAVLPQDFVWDEDSLVAVSDNVLRATAVYIGGNYDIDRLEFEIIIDEQTEQPLHAPPKSNDWVWAAVIVPVGVAAAIGAFSAALYKRSKRRKR